MSEFDMKYNIVDEVTPVNKPLTAHYKKSFAYYTIKDRLPVIITQIIDQLSRDKEIIAAENGGEATKDVIKEVQGNISKLKYELQTDKILALFTDDESDQELWNTFISNLDKDKNSFFTTTWLYAECYMYRRLKSFFEKSIVLKDFDYFRKQKENALRTSYETMIAVTEHIMDLKGLNKTDEELADLFQKLIKVNLWGNRCDLSISAGREIKQTGNPFSVLDSLESCILVNNCKDIWSCIKSGNGHIVIDFIQDNSGYELFTDFTLANFLIEYKLASKIRFHVKAIPWFISDVMVYDFHWSINTMRKHENSALSRFGNTISEYLENGQIEICPLEYFWTGPYEFYKMNIINKELYDKLSQSHLLIFKGDLNYRKLLGDFNWPYNTSFETVLREFRPTNLCALRTVKADLICELEDGKAEELSKIDPMWMETGQYGVIQFAPKINL